ncbi:MAG: hypothetical protein IPP64_09225 [Bacteroidetes bacterium]|nr:hypothetical protein [Bacteroidota bacterium]
MKKHILSILLILCISSSAFSQKKEKVIKYEKTFYKDQTIENMDVKITIDDAVATPTGIKFKITIINKSGDYIIFKPSECEFSIKGSKVKPIEKWLVIRPGDRDWRIVDIKGNYVVPENFEFLMAGLYKVTIDAAGNVTPDFKLPPANNEFKTGEFSVVLDGFKKRPQRQMLNLKCHTTVIKLELLKPIKSLQKCRTGKSLLII